MKVYKSYEDLPKIKLKKVKEVFISDSTNRDGSKMAGIVMKKKHKTEIFEYLHKIGIEKLETFVYNERDREAVKEMLDRGYEFPEVTGWAGKSKDIDSVLEMDDKGNRHPDVSLRLTCDRQNGVKKPRGSRKY
jgi:hypothetical protein